DHGMTPSESYRVLFRETLGQTVQRMLNDAPERADADQPRALESYGEAGEYADMGSRVVDTVRSVTSPHRTIIRSRLEAFGGWWRRHYGIREIIVPEKYMVASRHDVVVTYSSCLALVYFAADPKRLTTEDILADTRNRWLYESLLRHDAIGIVATLQADGSVRAEGRGGHAVVRDGRCVEVAGAGENPLEVYGTKPFQLRALEHLVTQHNAGDLVLFGAYDGYTIVSFDDQVGAHGSLGGDQVWPFLLTPPGIDVSNVRLEDSRDLYQAVMGGGG